MILIHRLGEKVKVIGILGYSGFFRGIWLHLGGYGQPDPAGWLISSGFFPLHPSRRPP